MTAAGVHPDDMFDDPTIDTFARDLRSAAAATPAPVVGAALASILDGSVVAPLREVPTVRAPRRATRGLRWAVGGVVFGLSAGGLGVAGALPGPVQEQVSRMADVVGVDLPDGSDSAPPATTPPPLPVTSLPTLPPAAPTFIPRPTAPPAVGHGQDQPDEADEHGNERGKPETTPVAPVDERSGRSGDDAKTDSEDEADDEVEAGDGDDGDGDGEVTDQLTRGHHGASVNRGHGRPLDAP